MPRRTMIRCTVTGATTMPCSALSTAARRAAPNLVSAQLFYEVFDHGAVLSGELVGADERSAKPSGPSAPSGRTTSPDNDARFPPRQLRERLACPGQPLT